MKFEIGKCYEHHSGSQYHISGEINTFMYGNCYIAENGYNTIKFKDERYNSEFIPVGKGEGYTDNWFEIPIEKFKLCNFDLNEKDKQHCLRVLKLKRIVK